MEPPADPRARTVELRALTPEDAEAYRPLRLEALRDAPSAFASSFEEEAARDLDALRARLRAGPDGATFGAFLDGRLVGTSSIFRLPRLKEHHKAYLVGMYVAPAARRTGIGRALVAAVLERARAMPGLRQVLLGVEAGNAPARALYEAFGFEAFGYEREALVVEGVAYDEVHMVRFLEDGGAASAPDASPPR
ncbi:MAG: GNAT family N-acetyltransferase [Trueperaceae bacterium]|nr:GNAT family N-acetyltransferase [Trueperaceae bacterium]